MSGGTVQQSQLFGLTAGSKLGVSPLWGTRGELFLESGRLRDWSRAGYGAGDRPIPSPSAFSDLIVDWDAAGDGVTDDTQVPSVAQVHHILVPCRLQGMLYAPPLILDCSYTSFRDPVGD